MKLNRFFLSFLLKISSLIWFFKLGDSKLSRARLYLLLPCLASTESWCPVVRIYCFLDWLTIHYLTLDADLPCKFMTGISLLKKFQTFIFKEVKSYLMVFFSQPWSAAWEGKLLILQNIFMASFESRLTATLCYSPIF